MCCTTNPANSQKDDVKHILYLNSYSLDYIWARDITAGLHAVTDTCSKIVLFTEFMDSRSALNPEEYYDKLHELLVYKYAQKHIDLLVCSDNNALDFILMYRDEPIFNLPLVYCGIYNTEDYYYPNDSIYGVKENIILEKSVYSILEMMPEVQTIHIVFDKTRTGNTYLEKLVEIERKLQGIVGFRYMNDIDMRLLPGAIAEIHPPDYILYLTVTQDKYGNRTDSKNVAKKIVSNAHTLVFGNPIANDQIGIIGGVSIEGPVQGQLAGEKAYQLLFNPNRASIPRITVPPVNFYIDYQLARQNHIDFTKLPTNTKFIHIPDTFYQRNKQAIFGTIVIFAALLIVILTLLRTLHVRKKYESELLTAMEKAEESDKLKSAFLTNLSHEIRTPLNVIMGFASLLEEKINSESDLHQYLHYITTSARSLQNLISEIIDIAKLETGQLEIDKEAINITDLLIESYQTFLPRQTKGSSELICENSQEDKIIIYSDYFRIRQVLINLIENAINYTQDGNVLFGCKTNKNDVFLFVKDDGIGIPAEYHEVIFKRFIKIEPETEKFRQGTGLGLTISRSITELLSGKLWVESEPGLGSTFILHLPTPVEIVSNEPDFIQLLVTNPIHAFDIIIAEPYDYSYQYLARLLGSSNQYKRSKNSHTLKSELHKHSYDLIFISYDLVANNIAYHMNEISELAHGTPIVFLNAYLISNEQKSELTQYGTYINKPFTDRELYALLDKITDLPDNVLLGNKA